MEIQLIEGAFNTAEGLDLITKLIEIKIKYQESKINENHNEEDSKSREAKIKRLQNNLNDLRKQLKESGDKSVAIIGNIIVN
jgi:hypothetical protein